MQAQNVLDDWPYYQANARNALYHAICRDAFAQLHQREMIVNTYRTRQNWLGHQQAVAAKLAEAVGPFPPKTPLNPRRMGSLEREAYTLEKLVLESRPNYFVTAALFLPKGKQGPQPAVIYCSGHTELGFRSDTYQHVILNLVQKGFIVLAFDPIGQGERQLYLDESGQSRVGGPTRQHSYPGAQAFLAGKPLAHHFVWDGIRMVDYLLSRDEVDPARIGITGRSGGGTQSAYIAAFDPRIHAAAPENYLTNFEYLLKTRGPQDAEQNFPRFLALGLDHADLVEVRGPKPYQILATTRDIFSVQGVRNTFRELTRMYEAFGAQDKLSLSMDDAGHTSTRKSREAMYAFFQRHLQLPGDARDEPVDTLSLDALTICPTGQVMSHFEQARSLHQLIVDDFVPPPPTSAARLRAQVLETLGYVPSTEAHKAVLVGRHLKEAYTEEHYLLEGKHTPIPLRLLYKDALERDRLVLVVRIREAGPLPGWMHTLLAQGHGLLVADLRGMGELGNGYLRGDSFIQNHSYNQWFGALLVGKSILAYQMQDLDLIVDFALQELGGRGLSAIGEGGPGLSLLHHQYVHGAFEQLSLIRTPFSYEEEVREKDYAPEFAWYGAYGAAAYYDPYDLSSDKVLWIDPVNARGNPLDAPAPPDRGKVMSYAAWARQLAH